MIKEITKSSIVREKSVELIVINNFKCYFMS